MLTEAVLIDLLHTSDISRVDQILLCLAVDPDRPKGIKEIKEIAIKAGLRTVEKWNISQLLMRTNNFAVRVPEGWKLRSEGKDYVAKIAGITSATKTAATSLRIHLSKLQNPQSLAFVEEALDCYEYGLLRAAVVLSWVGAVSVLYNKVIVGDLARFNAEASRRNPKWKVAVTPDDLARMKESDFLDIIDYLSIIGKNVKQELENCLSLRNACGHPNSLVIAEHRAASHLEILILNVFIPFV